MDHVVFTVVMKVPVKSTETESNCLAAEFEKSVYTCWANGYGPFKVGIQQVFIELFLLIVLWIKDPIYVL